jgi:hypothetical protein
VEILLYDRNRKPQNRTDFMRADQCAVSLLTTVLPLHRSLPKEKCYPAATECTSFLFDDWDTAQEFCEMKMKDFPSRVCEIFSSEGRAKPPLPVITHPDYEKDDDSGPASSKRRKLIVALVLTAGAAYLQSISGERVFWPLSWLPIVYCSVSVYWESAVKHREPERRWRVEAHRPIERVNA